MGRSISAETSHGHLATMNRDLNLYLSNSLASNTKKSYSAGEKQFLNFCFGFKLHELGPILPASEAVLCYFAVFLAKSVKHATIKSYLFAVKHLHLENSFNLDLGKCLRLQYVLRGIKRYQGKSSKIRRPITIDHLKLFFHLLQPNITGNFDSIMLWAAICLAFFGFLRISEFTCTQPLDSQKNLSFSDIQLLPTPNNPALLKINLKSSKTDPFRKGVTLTIGKTDNEVCAVQAVQRYLLISPYQEGPFFRYKTGSPLSRTSFTQDIRALLSKSGLSSSEFAGHSFRIGAATSAAAAQMPSWLIKTLGRWTSDCYERYVRTPDSVLISASRKLIQGH